MIKLSHGSVSSALTRWNRSRISAWSWQAHSGRFDSDDCWLIKDYIDCIQPVEFIHSTTFFTLHGIDVHVYLRSSQVLYQDRFCSHCLISEEMTIWLSQCPRVNSAQLPAKLLSNWDKNYAVYCIAPLRSVHNVCWVFWPPVILDKTLIRCNFDVKTVILQSLEAPVAITDDVTWVAQAFTMSLFVYIGSLTLTLCVFVSLLSYLSCRQ